MRSTALAVLILATAGCFAQTFFQRLQPGDSLLYYQCHVASHVREVNSGASIDTSGTELYTITDKFVVFRTAEGAEVKQYRARLTLFPNRRFAGLKMSERPYWEFYPVAQERLDASRAKIFDVIEKLGHEGTEYDFPVTRYNRNQVIIRYGSDFLQLILEKPLYLSDALR